MIFLGKELIPYKSISIVAEISCNHEGSLEQALDLISAAKESGADAVKIQCYTPEEMTTRNDSADFIIKNGPWSGWSLWGLYCKTHTPLEWLPKLFGYAKLLDIPMFASVFGEQSLAALEAVDCPAYKIASFELNDTNLIEMVASKHKPMILSTGVASSHEISRAVSIAKDYGIWPFVMHCISKYPAYLDEMELEKIVFFRDSYSTQIGLSDHTISHEAAQIAIALGATVLEKHLCLSNTSEDAIFSCLPHEFEKYVENCHNTIKALEIKHREPDKTFKRSLYVVKDIKKGDIFTKENVRSIRPGFGLDPDLLPRILDLDYKSACDLSAGTALKEEHLLWKTK